MTAEQLPLFNLPRAEGQTLAFKPLRHPIWTKNKAQLIARYLHYFVLITKHGTYIDGFAGPQSSDHPETWAAQLVLESEPRWLRSFSLCEADAAKVTLLERLRAAQPRRPARNVEVHRGDFNEIVSSILKSPHVAERIATFCLLDQRTFECEWRTVEALAQHKSGRKIEQFYFVPTGWLDRSIAGLRDHSIAERWWGKSDWQKLRGLPGHQQADMFCRRFRDELGYAYAYAFPIYDQQGRGRTMYYMVHATDHQEAPHLMARAYRKATGAPEPAEQLALEFKQWQDTRA